MDIISDISDLAISRAEGRPRPAGPASRLRALRNLRNQFGCWHASHLWTAPHRV